MILTGTEYPELSAENAALSRLLGALTLELPREKMHDPIRWAPPTVSYPIEIADIMPVVRS
jgi:hypothetical protein